MKSPPDKWHKIFNFLEDRWCELENIYHPALEIIEENETLLILQNKYRLVETITEINKQTCMVRSWSNLRNPFNCEIKLGSVTSTPFKAIKSIDITQNSELTVSLNLNWYSSIRIGSTESQVDASIIGARISTYTGIKVRAL